MVKSLYTGEVDMVGCSLTLTAERFRAVDYLYPLGLETYSIYIGNPESEVEDWELYLQPFKLKLWIFLLTAAMSLALTIRLVVVLYDFFRQAKEAIGPFLVLLGEKVWLPILNKSHRSIILFLQSPAGHGADRFR